MLDKMFSELKDDVLSKVSGGAGEGGYWTEEARNWLIRNTDELKKIVESNPEKYKQTWVQIAEKIAQYPQVASGSLGVDQMKACIKELLGLDVTNLP